MKPLLSAVAGLFVTIGGALAVTGAGAVDNSSLDKPEFREHKATYGLVYRLPKDVTEVLDNKIYPPLRDRLVKLGLVDEARTFNLQHVTVVHVHNADPAHASEDAARAAQSAARSQAHPQEFLHDGSLQRRRRALVVRSWRRQERPGLHGDDVLQHGGHGCAHTAARRAAAACHRAGLRKHGRCGTGARPEPWA